MLLSLKAVLLSSVIAFAAGNVSGGVVVWKMWNASVAKAAIASLQKQQKAAERAADGDRVSAGKDAEELTDFERRARDAQDKASDGVCFGADDIERLRTLWAE